MVQVFLDRAVGAGHVSSRPRAFSLAPGPRAADGAVAAGPPPAGWKEYTPAVEGFTVWVPEKPNRQGEDRRNIKLGRETARATGVSGRTEDGLFYRAEVFDLPAALARSPLAVYPAVRAALRDETKGKITESVAAKSGSMSGAEYRLEGDTEVTRVRVYVHDQKVYAVRVAGSAERVAAAEAETILTSFRVPDDAAAAPKGGAAGAPPKGGPATKGPKAIGVEAEPHIFGSIAHDPKFKTVGPAGAVLVGVEARFAKFGNIDIVRGVRPIYRVGGKEEFGEQFGNDLKGAVALKAKDG